jgi:metal-sulfur cluster biosynthetic enzyme
MSVPFALVRDLPPDEQVSADAGHIAGSSEAGHAPGSVEALWDALREVNDPELPISVVDMGLIVALERREGIVSLKLTFTAMGCPAMEMILGDIRDRLLQAPGVEQVEIEVVWDPPWTPARMTEEGRETLRMWGVGL